MTNRETAGYDYAAGSSSELTPFKEGTAIGSLAAHLRSHGVNIPGLTDIEVAGQPFQAVQLDNPTQSEAQAIDAI